MALDRPGSRLREALAHPRRLDESDARAGRTGGEDVTRSDVLVDSEIEGALARRVAIEAVGPPAAPLMQVDDVAVLARVHGGDPDS